jgi:hypothetical protein
MRRVNFLRLIFCRILNCSCLQNGRICWYASDCLSINCYIIRYDVINSNVINCYAFLPSCYFQLLGYASNCINYEPAIRSAGTWMRTCGKACCNMRNNRANLRRNQAAGIGGASKTWRGMRPEEQRKGQVVREESEDTAITLSYVKLLPYLQRLIYCKFYILCAV